MVSCTKHRSESECVSPCKWIMESGSPMCVETRETESRSHRDSSGVFNFELEYPLGKRHSDRVFPLQTTAKIIRKCLVEELDRRMLVHLPQSKLVVRQEREHWERNVGCEQVWKAKTTGDTTERRIAISFSHAVREVSRWMREDSRDYLRFCPAIVLLGWWEWLLSLPVVTHIAKEDSESRKDLRRSLEELEITLHSKLEEAARETPLPPATSPEEAKNLQEALVLAKLIGKDTKMFWHMYLTEQSPQQEAIDSFVRVNLATLWGLFRYAESLPRPEGPYSKTAAYLIWRVILSVMTRKVGSKPAESLTRKARQIHFPLSLTREEAVAAASWLVENRFATPTQARDFLPSFRLHSKPSLDIATEMERLGKRALELDREILEETERQWTAHGGKPSFSAEHHARALEQEKHAIERELETLRFLSKAKHPPEVGPVAADKMTIDRVMRELHPELFPPKHKAKVSRKESAEEKPDTVEPRKPSPKPAAAKTHKKEDSKEAKAETAKAAAAKTRKKEDSKAAKTAAADKRTGEEEEEKMAKAWGLVFDDVFKDFPK